MVRGRLFEVEGICVMLVSDHLLTCHHPCNVPVKGLWSALSHSLTHSTNMGAAHAYGGIGLNIVFKSCISLKITSPSLKALGAFESVLLWERKSKTLICPKKTLPCISRLPELEIITGLLENPGDYIIWWSWRVWILKITVETAYVEIAHRGSQESFPML